MRTPLMLTCLALATLAAGAADAACKLAANYDGAADAAGVTKVVVNTGPGDLSIVGRSDAQRVVAKGSACASSQPLFERLKLEVRREGDIVYVDAGIGNTDNVVTIGNSYAYINVGIAVPAQLPIEVRDSSGDTHITGVERLDLTDSSGDIEVRDIGSAVIKDSSGDIEVNGARGDVTVTFDGSGDITIHDVGGNVEIGSDGSGGIRVTGVKGNVTVGNDGSGSIDVADVGGDFTVDSDGSGGITHRGVAGKVSIP